MKTKARRSKPTASASMTVASILDRIEQEEAHKAAAREREQIERQRHPNERRCGC